MEFKNAFEREAAMLAQETLSREADILANREKELKRIAEAAQKIHDAPPIRTSPSPVPKKRPHRTSVMVWHKHFFKELQKKYGWRFIHITYVGSPTGLYPVFRLCTDTGRKILFSVTFKYNSDKKLVAVVEIAEVANGYSSNKYSFLLVRGEPVRNIAREINKLLQEKLQEQHVA
jgi:hypothetical protein